MTLHFPPHHSAQHEDWLNVDVLKGSYVALHGQV